MTGGASLFVGGVILRGTAVLELGALYPHRVQVTESQRLVETGPYRWLRPPAYAGMLLAPLGLVLVFFDRLNLVLWLAAVLPSLVMRIRIEERRLASPPG